MKDVVVEQAVERIGKLMAGRECVAVSWRHPAVSGVEGRWREAEVRDEVEKAGFTLDFHSDNRDDDIVVVRRVRSPDMFEVGASLYEAMAFGSKPVVCRCCGQEKGRRYFPEVRKYDVVGTGVCPVHGDGFKVRTEGHSSFVVGMDESPAYFAHFYPSEAEAMKAAEDEARMRTRLASMRYRRSVERRNAA